MDTAPRALPRIHALLAVQSLVVVLVSVNRLGTFTLGYVAPNEFLRWVDLLNMLVFPLLSLVAFYLVKKELELGAPRSEVPRHRALNLAFMVGVYLLGASYGTHEVTNYLHIRFCAESASDWCGIVAFNDDQFSHWVFFTGFVLVNASLLLLQDLFPSPTSPRRTEVALLVVNGLFIGLGIFANLAFEEIGLDLYVVAALAALSAVMLWKRGRQPLTIYYLTAYAFGLAAAGVYRALAP